MIMILRMLVTIERNLQNERDNKLWKMHSFYELSEKQLHTFIHSSNIHLTIITTQNSLIYANNLDNKFPFSETIVYNN